MYKTALNQSFNLSRISNTLMMNQQFGPLNFSTLFNRLLSYPAYFSY